MNGAKAKLEANSRVAKSLASERYEGFDGQYIGGFWRPGRIGTKAIDRDPYSGEVVAEIIEGDHADLDEAYRAAAAAQAAWAALAPAARAAGMLRAVTIPDGNDAQM